MVIKFNKNEITCWLPSVSDCTLSNSGYYHCSASADLDGIETSASKFQNNGGDAWGKSSFNLNTLFGKSGKTKFMLTCSTMSVSANTNQNGTCSSYIRLSDGTTHTQLLYSSIDSGNGTYRCATNSATFHIEKVTATNLTITLKKSYTHSAGISMNGTSTVLTTSTVTYANFSSLVLESYSAMSGGYITSAGHSYTKTFMSFPKFTSRFS